MKMFVYSVKFRVLVFTLLENGVNLATNSFFQCDCLICQVPGKGTQIAIVILHKKVTRVVFFTIQSAINVGFISWYLFSNVLSPLHGWRFNGSFVPFLISSFGSFQLRTSWMLGGEISFQAIDWNASIKDQAHIITMWIPITILCFATNSVTLVLCHNMVTVWNGVSLKAIKKCVKTLKKLFLCDLNCTYLALSNDVTGYCRITCFGRRDTTRTSGSVCRWARSVQLASFEILIECNKVALRIFLAFVHACS